MLSAGRRTVARTRRSRRRGDLRWTDERQRRTSPLCPPGARLDPQRARVGHAVLWHLSRRANARPLPGRDGCAAPRGTARDRLLPHRPDTACRRVSVRPPARLSLAQRGPRASSRRTAPRNQRDISLASLSLRRGGVRGAVPPRNSARHSQMVAERGRPQARLAGSAAARGSARRPRAPRGRDAPLARRVSRCLAGPGGQRLVCPKPARFKTHRQAPRAVPADTGPTPPAAARRRGG